MPDQDGYPTDEELQKLRDWPLDYAQVRDWLEYAQSLWWAPDWGWPEVPVDDRPFIVSTGGWSGNESIIHALMHAHYGILWHHVWEMTRRGGHYMLRIPSAEKHGKTPEAEIPSPS